LYGLFQLIGKKRENVISLFISKMNECHTGLSCYMSFRLKTNMSALFLGH